MQHYCCTNFFISPRKNALLVLVIKADLYVLTLVIHGGNADAIDCNDRFILYALDPAKGTGAVLAQQLLDRVCEVPSSVYVHF